MGFEYINAGKLDEYIGVPEVVIIDLREPRQYAWFHFAGAINVPYHRMETLLDNGGHDKGSANGVYDKGSANGVYDKGSASVGYDKGSANGVYDKGSANGGYGKGSANVVYDKGSASGGHDKGSANGVYDKGSANGGYDKSSSNGVYDKSSAKSHGKNYGRAFDRNLDRSFGRSSDRSGKLIISGNEYDRSNYFIFYCERGSLSMIISSRMASMGYNAGTVVGGIRQYRGRNMVR